MINAIFVLVFFNDDNDDDDNDNDNNFNDYCRKKNFKSVFIIFFFFIFFFIVVALIYIDSLFYLLVDFDAIFQLIREHDFLNRLDANVLSIREIVVVEIRDAVFQSIRFVNLDVVVKFIRKLEFHHFIIIFHFFR